MLDSSYVEEEVRMKSWRLSIFLVMVCMFFLLAGQTAFGATKIVKFNVPSCE